MGEIWATVGAVPELSAASTLGRGAVGFVTE